MQMPFLRRRRSWRRVAFLVLAALFLATPGGVAPSPAAAQQPAAPAGETIGSGELETLLRTIEDPAAREAFVNQLKALIAAKRQSAPAPERGFAGSLLDQLTQEVKRTSEQFGDAAAALKAVPGLLSWFHTQITDADRRERWGEIFLQIFLVLGPGLVAEWMTRSGLARPRSLLEARTGESRLIRLPFLFLRGILDLMPVAAFAVVAYLLLPVVQPTAALRGALLQLISAYVSVGVITALARFAFAPAAPGLRALPLGDETANYLFIWIRRFGYVAVVGYFVIQAAWLLGFPLGGYDLAMKLLGLVVGAMVIVFILQNRQPVAEAIRGRDAKSVALRALRNRLADVWHVLASIYVAASCIVWMFGVRGGFEYVFQATVLSLLIVTVAVLANTALGRGLETAFAIKDELRARFPSLENRANRYVSALHMVVRLVIWALATLAVLHAWGIDSFGWLTGPFGQRILSSGFSIAVILILALVIWETVSSAIERYLNQKSGTGVAIDRGNRARTLLPLLRNVTFIALAVMVTLIVLSEIGVDIGPLLAGAGVIGLALGIGSQKLVQDVITGAFILFEDAVAVGDTARVGDHEGLVEAVTIRSIRLRDGSGAVHTIPFSTVNTVSNLTRGYSAYEFTIGIGYGENIDRVLEVLKEVGADLQKDPRLQPLILEALDMWGVDSFGDSAVILKGKIKTRPGKQATVGRELNRRVKNRFDELGIEMPFPHRTLYFGEDKQGRAAAARIALTETPGEKKGGQPAARSQDGAPPPATKATSAE